MKKIFHLSCREYLKNLFLCAAVIMTLTQGMAFAAEKYPPRRGTAVNDFAGVIDAANAVKMESLAREILQKTGMSVVVVTMPELGSAEEINLYATGLYQAWGIGKKGEDKGVLILLAVKERQIRIETGYGVEGDLTDGIVGLILDRYVVPHLKAGKTGKALYNAMYSCGVVVAGKAGVTLTGVDVPYRSPSQPGNQGLNVFALIFIVVAAILLLGTRTGREILPWILLMLVTNSGGRGGGGGFGGGFGGFGGGMSGGGGAGRSF
ncbi:MAG TPA: TPM domain-containing protein [Smithellaceae bacterium]|nr:TPM domain-containing protein [Smithella sp.]HOG82417.1 TPM domain-containing protein [Smithellaceae bacterium]HRY35770.1 TPM domain-containing protein [Smithellaceae bacterium]